MWAISGPPRRRTMSPLKAPYWRRAGEGSTRHADAATVVAVRSQPLGRYCRSYFRGATSTLLATYRTQLRNPAADYHAAPLAPTYSLRRSPLDQRSAQRGTSRLPRSCLRRPSQTRVTLTVCQDSPGHQPHADHREIETNQSKTSAAWKFRIDAQRHSHGCSVASSSCASPVEYAWNAAVWTSRLRCSSERISIPHGPVQPAERRARMSA